MLWQAPGLWVNTVTEEQDTATDSESNRALAERAERLGVQVQVLAGEIQRGASQERLIAIRRTLDVVTAALHGWDSKRVHRMQIVEAVEHAATEQRDAEAMRHRFDKPGRPSQLSAAVDTIVQMQTRDFASLLSSSTIEAAVGAWNRDGGLRSDSKAPLVWDAILALVTEAGFGGVKAETIRKEWIAWQKMRGR